MPARLDVARFERRRQPPQRRPVVLVQLVERRVQAVVGDAQLIGAQADEFFEVALVLAVGDEQLPVAQFVETAVAAGVVELIQFPVK